jgi:uncharacterized membrane protein
MSEEMGQNWGENPQKTEKQKFKNAICYIPFVAVVLFFVEQEKTPEFNKHLKYGIFLLIWFILTHFVVSMVIPFINLWWIVVLAYLIASGYLWYKAYAWEDFNIKAIDDIEKKVQENIK